MRFALTCAALQYQDTVLTAMGDAMKHQRTECVRICRARAKMSMKNTAACIVTQHQPQAIAYLLL